MLQHTAKHCKDLCLSVFLRWMRVPIQMQCKGRCNTLQHIATHCNTLQHTATHCNTLQHTATHCNRLQRTAAHCNTLQHTAWHMTYRTFLVTHPHYMHMHNHTKTTNQHLTQIRTDSSHPLKTMARTHCNTHCNILLHTATQSVHLLWRKTWNGIQSDIQPYMWATIKYVCICMFDVCNTCMYVYVYMFVHTCGPP